MVIWDAIAPIMTSQHLIKNIAYSGGLKKYTGLYETEWFNRIFFKLPRVQYTDGNVCVQNNFDKVVAFENFYAKKYHFDSGWWKLFRFYSLRPIDAI